MTDREKFDLLYEALKTLRHRDLEILTNYGTQSVNGRRAKEQIKDIEELRKLLYPYTSEFLKWKTSA